MHKSHPTLPFNLTDIFNGDTSPNENEAVDPIADSKPDLLPISLRVTQEEKGILLHESGKQSMSSYIRTQLFDEATDRAVRYRKKRRNAEPDSVLIAKLLGMLGQDDMVKALFGLLVAAESDRVAMSDEAQDSLHRACAQIDEMRDMLVVALGVKPQSKSRR